MEICVIGAGIGGLAFARAAALNGARVTVLEQAEAIQEVGAGLQISPNGLCVLRALGLENALAEHAVRAMSVSLRDFSDGAEVVALDLTRLPSDHGYYFVHRADLIDLLAQGARDAGVQIVLNTTAATIEHRTRPTVVTPTGTRSEADLIVGADGVHSVTRQLIAGKSAPFFTGQVAWRAVVPNDLHFPPQARVYMGPKRHLVCYPLRKGKLLNIVAVQERHEWVEESWHNMDDPKNLKAAFADFGNDVHALLERVDQVSLWGLFRHPVAQVWHNGYAAILGDAAHPTLPFMAQGANMALEDAWALADELARDHPLDTALAAYQARRKTRASKVIDAASKNAWKYHLSFRPLRWVAHKGLGLLGSLAPDQLLHQFDWIYNHDETKQR